MRANSRFNHIIKSDRPVVVDFYADWCQPCKEIQPVLKEVKNIFRENVRIVKVNVDQKPWIANDLNVKSIPTLIVFKGGNVEWFAEGFVGVTELSNIIKQFIPEQ